MLILLFCWQSIDISVNSLAHISSQAQVVLSPWFNMGESTLHDIALLTTIAVQPSRVVVQSHLSFSATSAEISLC